MKRFLTCFVSVFFLSLIPLELQAQEPKTHEFLKGMISYEYKLPNGLTVVLTPNPRAPLTSVIHWVKAGSLHEKKGITGIAHLFEHMMFRPIKGSKETFFDQTQALGAEVNANTRYGSTVYLTQLPHENLLELLKVESNRFKNMVVTDELLKIEKEAVRSEYETKMDSQPMVDLWTSLFTKAYPGHPFEWTVVGFREDLDKITSKDCNEFFAKYYKAANTGLFISGNFDRIALQKAIEAAYGDWAPGEPSKLPKSYSSKTEFTAAEGKLASMSSSFVVGYRIPYPSPADNIKMQLAIHMMFDSQRDLLKQRIVYQDKIASQATSMNTEYDWGMFEFVLTLVPPATTDQALASLEKISDDIAQMPDEDYKAYIRDLQDSVALMLLTNLRFNNTLALSWGKYGDLTLIPQMIQQAPTLSKEDLAEWLKLYVRKSNAILVESKKVSRGQK